VHARQAICDNELVGFATHQEIPRFLTPHLPDIPIPGGGAPLSRRRVARGRAGSVRGAEALARVQRLALGNGQWFPAPIASEASSTVEAEGEVKVAESLCDVVCGIDRGKSDD
jgi:hypothetical protein